MECEAGDYEVGMTTGRRLIEMMRAAPKAANLAHGLAANSAGYVGSITGQRDLIEAASEAAQIVLESSNSTRLVTQLAQVGLAEAAVLDQDEALAEQL